MSDSACHCYLQLPATKSQSFTFVNWCKANRQTAFPDVCTSYNKTNHMVIWNSSFAPPVINHLLGQVKFAFLGIFGTLPGTLACHPVTVLTCTRARSRGPHTWMVVGVFFAMQTSEKIEKSGWSGTKKT